MFPCPPPPPSLSLSLSLSLFLSPGTNLSYYKSEEDYSRGETFIQRFNLTGAEAIPDVDVSKKKFAMNIILPSSDETGEIRLVFESVSQILPPCRTRIQAKLGQWVPGHWAQ